MSELDKILKKLVKLNDSEKSYLIRYLIKSERKIKGLDIKSFVCNERFKNGIVCPFCGSVYVVKNGKRKDGTQKYKCVDCGKYFIATSNSIVSGTKKDVSLWERYIVCMIDGLSIRATAQRLNIAVNTAFVWRHKILDALSTEMDTVILSNIVEADETFFNISYKGNHKKSKTFKIPRKSRHRGKSVFKRGISKEKVCVSCAVDRNKNAISKVTNKGRVSVKGLHNIFDNRITLGSTIVTDKMNSYRAFTKDNGLNLIQLKGKISRKGIYNIQTVNSYHSRLKGFLDRFNGVSTKYLNNYLVWHNMVNFNRYSYSEIKDSFITLALTVQITARYADIPGRPALPVVA